MTRRSFLSAVLLAPALARQTPPGGRLIGTVPLGAPGGNRNPTFGQLLGTGLDARLYNDLSVIGPDRPDTLVTPADRFFVRTAVPSSLPRTDDWSLRVDGLVRAPVTVALRDVESLPPSSGRHLIECAGNLDQGSFGLMSAADWEGVPIRAVLDRAQPSRSGYRVLVTGVDDRVSPMRTSVPGASWIFSPDELDRAILAVRMNGQSLPRDHGFPVRLVVPNWYGAACIKWVNRIELVADEAPPTSQMVEYAARTHQPREATLAREFVPATVDTAAMPVRVEKWLVAGRLQYRVIGIVWGGTTPTNALAIRFKTAQPWVPVEHCPLPASTTTWSVWTHTWRPDEPGHYQIVLKVTDPAVRTRRLDLFFYVREAVVDEI